MYSRFVFACICLSFGFTLATHGSDHGHTLPDNHETFEHIMAIQGQVFAFELIFEVVLALLALGPAAYFSQGWMIFDFVIACGMAIGLIGRYYPFSSQVRKFLQVN